MTAPLHDRIAALATYRVHHANMGLCPEGPDDPSRDPECEVCGWLAETTTTQPEAGAVERAARALDEAGRCLWDGPFWNAEHFGDQRTSAEEMYATLPQIARLAEHAHPGERLPRWRNALGLTPAAARLLADELNRRADQAERLVEGGAS